MPKRWHTSAAAILILYVASCLVLVIADGDRWLANHLFYDATARAWLGGGSGAWWAQTLIHGGGRQLIRSIGAATLAAALIYPPWRRQGLYVVASLVATVAIVGALKAVSHVACPWDLAAFGAPAAGSASRAGACFPGGHSSSGFALVSFYFVCQADQPRLARAALLLALALGGLFAFGQEARGAHFLSHDLTSAVIAWLVAMGLAKGMLAHD